VFRVYGTSETLSILKSLCFWHFSKISPTHKKKTNMPPTTAAAPKKRSFSGGGSTARGRSRKSSSVSFSNKNNDPAARFSLLSPENSKKGIRTELDEVVLFDNNKNNGSDDDNDNTNTPPGKRVARTNSNSRLVAKVVVLDDDDDEDTDDVSSELEEDVKEEIVGTQVGEEVEDDDEEEEEEEEDFQADATMMITPATAKRNKQKFQLHQLCADGDVAGVMAWMRSSLRADAKKKKKKKRDDDTRTAKKSAKKFFASGTPAATSGGAMTGGQTWPPPPVKEIFDAKTGRKLTPDPDDVGVSGEGGMKNEADDKDRNRNNEEEEEEEEECDVNVRDDNGNTPLAIASALSDEEASISITEALLGDESIDVFGFCDVDGYAAVHWACKIGNAKTLELLLAHEKSLVNFRADDLKCSTPAMIASKYAQFECLNVLKAFHCNINLRDIYGTSILFECASELSTAKERTKWHSKTRKFLLDTFPELRVAVLHHADCGDHVSVRPHQESPDRIVAILKALEIASEEKSSLKASGGGFFKDEFRLDDAFPEADPEDVLRAHTEDYVATLAELGEAVGDTPIAFTPFVQTKRGLPPRKIKPTANSDTFWSSGTLRAASRAAGAAVEAVKRVAEGRNRHVFCCVRPPGHHAGLEGATENAVSSGFSIVNNAMIGTFSRLVFNFFRSCPFWLLRKRSDCPSSFS